AAVPRAVLGGKQVAAVFSGKLRAVVKREPERGRMGLEQDVWHRDLVLKVRSLALVPRIFVGADVVPRPAVECALANPGDVVGRNVVADRVALVGRAPHVAIGTDRKADAIADTGGVDATVAAIGVEHQNSGTIGLGTPGCAERMLRRPRLDHDRIEL